MRKVFFIILYFVFCISCKKDKHQDNSSVELKIIKPTANQVFSVNDTIIFEFEASNKREFHGYEFRILSLPTKKVIKIHGEHLHQKNISKTYMWRSDSLGKMQFEVKVLIDHDGNFKMDTVNFEVQ